MFAGLPKKYPSAAWKHPADVFVGYTGPWQEAARQTAITSREEAWAAFELQYYENFFTTIEDLTVSVTTFNAGSKKPNLPMQQLVELVSVDDQGRSVPVDLIVLSFQEIDMSTAAMLREETEASMPWIAAANAAIGADDNVQGSSPYFALPTRQLVGILLCVYVRRELLPYVREHSVSTVATGALGSIGNKGAVGLHLVIHRTSICCIAAHLAAGHSNVRKRNEDINNIFQSMDFNAARRADMGSTSGALQYPELLPLTHDWTIVAGDLNYRVNLTYEKALNLIQANDVTQLLKYDQFEAELSHVPTPWAGFICPKPDFLPTYRFDIGTDRYDTSEKRRIPSFTDRIGFHPRKVEHQSHLCLRKWGSLQAIRCSDHKPVQAVARLSMRVENPDSLKQYYASLLSGIRERGYELGSQCSIDCSTTNLDFGTIQFCKPESSRELVITNTGACVAVVRVLRLVEGETTATADGMWLRVSPQEFALLPGESEVVSLRTELHPRCLPWLSRWKPGRGTTAVGLTARLMLCVRNGSDQVVKCGAVLLPSIFGNSLENIAALHEHPCMEAYGLNAGDLVRDIDEDEERANLARSPAVPKEFWYLVDAITRNPRVPGLFVTPPNDHSVTEEVAEYLIRHNDTIPDEFDVLATAECLYALLESLQEPVIPFREYQAALTAGKSRAKALAFIQTLPVLHGNLWIFMMSMLNYLLRPEHVRCNGLTPNELARVFAEVLLDRPRDVEGDDPMMKGRGENHVNMKARQISERESEEATALVLQFLDPPVDLAR